MDEMLREETTMERFDNCEVVDNTNEYQDDNSGSGLASKLIIGGALAVAGAVGALIYKKKKADNGKLTKADERAIKRLEKKGFVVSEQLADDEDDDFVDEELETEQESEEKKSEEKTENK